MNPPDPEDARWLTPDPLGGDIMNPQSLNRYAGACPERSRRVTNNPATFNDPLGLGDATACWMFNFLWPGCENIGASGGDNGTNPADPGSDPSFAASHAQCGGPTGLPAEGTTRI